MANTTYTPGPWAGKLSAQAEPIYGTYRFACVTARNAHGVEITVADTRMAHAGSGPTVKANTQLVAAAPTMLDALKAGIGRMMDTVGHDCEGDPEVDCALCDMIAAKELAVGVDQYDESEPNPEGRVCEERAAYGFTCPRCAAYTSCPQCGFPEDE